MTPGGGETSGVAGHVIAMNEAEIELGFRVQPQPGERRCKRPSVTPTHSRGGVAHSRDKL
jgi:hypothetical protein